MAREPSPEMDDELFNEVYGKAYSGPATSAANNMMPKGNAEKRALGGEKSDEEDEPRDPNAVPTDFTSREAKVWEAKAKATERNWKKRKEEEMICKLCGESGHFTQGCPSTLGANRRTADFFERVPARDKQVRDLFTQKVISQIEKDVGCKIRMDEKFLFVSGRDRLILAKGVDAVHKVIQEGKGKSNSSSSPNRARSRSPVRSPKGSHFRRSDSRWSHSPRNASRSQSRPFRNERPVNDHSHEDMPKFSKGSPQAYAKYGAKGRSTQSISPRRPTYVDDAFISFAGDKNYAAMHKPHNLIGESHGTNSRSDHKLDAPSYPQTLEELELEFKREAIELARTRDQEEDEENYKHRESIREMRENYMNRMVTMRSTHARKWEEFLEHGLKRQQQAHHTAYSQSSSDYDQRKMQFVATGPPIDSRDRYPYPGDNYSAPRPQAAYGEFQLQRHDDFGKNYGRY